MNVARDCMVSIDYTLKSGAGELIDSSEGGEPLEYLQGHGQIVPGLENALEGAAVGDKRVVVVAPVDGYGERDEGAVFVLDRAAFPPGAELEVGHTYLAKTASDQMVRIRVIDVTGDKVKLDGNHPLAGVELHFEVIVRGVRSASAEEIASAKEAASDEPG